MFKVIKSLDMSKQNDFSEIFQLEIKKFKMVFNQLLVKIHSILNQKNYRKKKHNLLILKDSDQNF